MSAAVASALLATACGFGATVWFLIAHHNRHTNRWQSVLYALVALIHVAIAVLLTSRIVGRPITLTPFFSIILLSVVFVVPPAIQLAAYLKARKLIDEQRTNGD